MSYADWKGYEFSIARDIARIAICSRWSTCQIWISTYYSTENIAYISSIPFQDPKQRRMFDYFHALMDDEEDLLKWVEEGEPPEKRVKTDGS